MKIEKMEEAASDAGEILSAGGVLTLAGPYKLEGKCDSTISSSRQPW